MTDEQRAAVDRLQADQNNGATTDDRKRFLHAIASVPKEELETAPKPPPEKRGRKPSANP